jgi:hypothetical protein
MLGVKIFYLYAAICAFLLLFLLFWGFRINDKKELSEKKSALVKQHVLTDFCLTTDTPYGRHLNSQSPISVFADFPAYHGHGKTDFVFLRNFAEGD